MNLDLLNELNRGSIAIRCSRHAHPVAASNQFARQCVNVSLEPADGGKVRIADHKYPKRRCLGFAHDATRLSALLRASHARFRRLMGRLRAFPLATTHAAASASSQAQPAPTSPTTGIR